MTRPLLSLITALTALAISVPVDAQDEPPAAPSPGEIVAAAPGSEWVAIPVDDLLVMTLAPDAEGNERKVIIQLMPAPFSQGWVDNIRTLARAKWYDGISVNRVQDNYVVQWGDPNVDNPEATGAVKPLPQGLRVMAEEDYQSRDYDIADASVVELDELENQLGSVPEAVVIEIEEGQKITFEQTLRALEQISAGVASEREEVAMISIEPTQTAEAPEGWHQRDSYAGWTEIWQGWPLANYQNASWIDDAGNVVPDPKLTRHEARAIGLHQDVEASWFWPVHCYGMVGVGRGMSPDTGTGAELYTVIGHAPRHLDRNIALVGRVIEGMEHLSSLPRGHGDLGFYAADEVDKRTPIMSIRVASDLPAAEQPHFQYLNTDGETFAQYAAARANRRDPFFIVPAGGADICNIPVPVRRVP